MATTQSPARLLSRKEAADVLGVTPETLAVWACERRYNLPMVKVGKRAMYRPSDIETWCRDRTVGGKK